VLLAVIPENEVDQSLTELERQEIPFTVIGRVVEGKGNCSESFKEELWGLLAR